MGDREVRVKKDWAQHDLNTHLSVLETAVLPLDHGPESTARNESNIRRRNCKPRFCH